MNSDYLVIHPKKSQEDISYDRKTLPKLWSVDRKLKLPAKSLFINSSNCDESIVGSLSDLRFKEI
jgi:hypothetical protein